MERQASTASILTLPRALFAQVGRHLDLKDRRAASLAHPCFEEVHALIEGQEWRVPVVSQAEQQTIGQKLRSLLKRKPLLSHLDVVLCPGDGGEEGIADWQLGDAADVLGERRLAITLSSVDGPLRPSLASDAVFIRRMLRPFAKLCRRQCHLEVAKVWLFGADAVRELVSSHPGLPVDRIYLFHPAGDVLRRSLVDGCVAAVRCIHVVHAFSVPIVVDAEDDRVEAALRGVKTVVLEARGAIRDWRGRAARASTTLATSTYLTANALTLEELDSIGAMSREPGSRLELLVLRAAAPAEMMRDADVLARLLPDRLAPGVEVVLAEWTLGDPSAAALVLWLLRSRRASLMLPSGTLARARFTQILARVRRALTAASDEARGRFRVRSRYDGHYDADAAGTPTDARIASDLAALPEAERGLWA